jgi:pyrroline-5-carboxylate reductase
MPTLDPPAPSPVAIPVPLAFIGGGNMARSLIGGLLARGVAPESIVVSEPVDALRVALATDFGVRVREDNVAAARGARVLLLAVKPQVMRTVCEGLAGRLGDTLVVSIAAGISCAQLRRWLRHDGGIVRCMPNTPALIGAGASGLYATPSTDAAQRAVAERLLGAAGLCVWIDEEARMDAVTALSGSGPAYVFLLAEAMQEAAIGLGLAPAAARALTRQTLLGAARMLDESGEEAALLRARVTSPGGTTQAALDSFEADGFRAVVQRALAAAERRGAELSHQLGD